jgi:microcystin-dependent protein
MGQPYVGEIRIFAGNFPINGWAFCDGQQLAIADNQTLFTLIGTTYGGDGQTTFALPDLRSRVPIHQGNGLVVGQAGGAEQVTLTTSQIPAHSHVPQANSGPGNQQGPGGGVWATPSTGTIYSNVAPSLVMDPGAVGSAGGSQPHDNMVPFLGVNFIISLFGIFPSQA